MHAAAFVTEDDDSGCNSDFCQDTSNTPDEGGIGGGDGGVGDAGGSWGDGSGGYGDDWGGFGSGGDNGSSPDGSWGDSSGSGGAGDDDGNLHDPTNPGTIIIPAEGGYYELIPLPVSPEDIIPGEDNDDTWDPRSDRPTGPIVAMHQPRRPSRSAKAKRGGHSSRIKAHS